MAKYTEDRVPAGSPHLKTQLAQLDQQAQQLTQQGTPATVVQDAPSDTFRIRLDNQ